MANNKVVDVIVEQVLAQLEKGKVPWNCPYKFGRPRNLVSGKPYRGLNVFLCNLTMQDEGYTDNVWLTFKQAQQRGGTVRKGEKSTVVSFYKSDMRNVTNNETGADELKRLFMLRYYRVFNIAQCDGVEFTPSEPVEHIESIDQRIKPYMDTLNGYEVRADIETPHYQPSIDTVRMLPDTAYPTPSEYYGVLFHELMHSTGAEHRLKRDLGVMRKGSYSREELVAEMGAALMALETGTEIEPNENHASYIAGWASQLANQRLWIVWAAGKAQRGADLILGNE